MFRRVLAALTVFAAGLVVSPASAVDTNSIGAFVSSCRDEAKQCQAMTVNAILSAKNAKYGCIPADLSDDKAGEKLLDWLKTVANAGPKYQKEPLADLMWTGIDELWPCKK